MHLLTGDEVGRSLQEGPQVLALHVDRESFGAAPAIAYARLTDLEFSAFNRLPLAAQSSAPHAHCDRIPGRTHSRGFTINEFSRSTGPLRLPLAHMKSTNRYELGPRSTPHHPSP